MAKSKFIKLLEDPISMMVLGLLLISFSTMDSSYISNLGKIIMLSIGLFNLGFGLWKNINRRKN